MSTAVYAPDGSTVLLCVKDRLTAETAGRIKDKLRPKFPNVEFVLTDIVTSVVVNADPTGDDDLTIAATRLHDALYRKGGEMDEHLGEEVVSAFGQLQQALKRRGWTP